MNEEGRESSPFEGTHAPSALTFTYDNTISPIFLPAHPTHISNATTATMETSLKRFLDITELFDLLATSLTLADIARLMRTSRALHHAFQPLLLL